jgi:hypothetical protein
MFKKLVSNFIPVVAKFFSSKIDSKRELTESEKKAVAGGRLIILKYEGVDQTKEIDNLVSRIKLLINIIEG